MSIENERKEIIVFDPVERSRSMLGDLLQGMGYATTLHDQADKLHDESHSKKGADLLIINLAVLGETYQEVIDALSKLGLPGEKTPPVIAVTTLRLSPQARSRLDSLGVGPIFSEFTPFVELLFAVNHVLFPKYRELRRYARVFGGFPIQFRHDGQWRSGEVYNISQEGAFIQCKKPLEENTEIQVRFVLPDQNHPLAVDAKVNWVNDTSDKQEQLSPPGMGIRFVTLNQAESSTLGKFIQSRVNGTDSNSESSSSSS